MFRLLNCSVILIISLDIAKNGILGNGGNDLQKKARGTFFSDGNTSNLSVDMFSNLKSMVKFLSHPHALDPPLGTKLFATDYLIGSAARVTNF